MSESELPPPETEVPEYLADVAYPEAEAETVPVPRTGVMRFARMTGSSIAARDAAPWVTDFLNAAYYRRDAGEREVDDLRLAFSVLTTHWGQGNITAQSLLHQLALRVAATTSSA